jgi:hypothetical protein
VLTPRFVTWALIWGMQTMNVSTNNMEDGFIFMISMEPKGSLFDGKSPVF